MSSTALVAIGVLVVLVLAFLTVAPMTRSMERLRVAVLIVLGLGFLRLVGSALVECLWR
jgi:multisubunit Na+/H+ antiporter MnhB subunit